MVSLPRSTVVLQLQIYLFFMNIVIMIIERPDRKGNADITIRYYETAIEFTSGKRGWAQILMKMSNIEGNTLYTIELIGIKNKPNLIDEPLSEEAIRASDPIIKLPSEP